MKAWTQRVEFAKAIRGHWSVRLLAWGWGVCGTLSIVRDEFFPSNLYQGSATPAFLPHFRWYIWVIGFLAILTMKIFEGSFRAYGKNLEAAPAESPRSQPHVASAQSVVSSAGIPIGAFPTMPPARPPTSAPGASDLANDLLKPPPPQRPNLIFLGTEIVHINFIQSKVAGETFSETQDTMVPRGIIACFRNEPSRTRPVADAKSVRACVNFRDARERAVGKEVASACWLEHHPDSISFAVGDRHCVLLGLIEMGRTLRVPWKRRHREMMGLAFATECATVFEPASIEVRLVGENNELLADPLLLDITFEDRDARISPRKP